MSIVAILVLLAVAWSVLTLGQISNPFRTRTCQSRLWRRAFPWASKRQIREFLTVCAEAFSFRDTEKLKFRPDDQLLGIYKALHPSKWATDAAAFQKLAAELRTRYGVALDDTLDARMTLGALFAQVEGRRAAAGK